jgi:hypothetical protein
VSAFDQLPSKDARKAALTCQKLIAQVGAKVLNGKFKALDACANAALACVQTRQSDGDTCRTKAAKVCVAKLGKFDAITAKANEKIMTAKSCATKLRLADLLAADGLGFVDLKDECEHDGLDICEGLAPLAACLVRKHERAAGFLYCCARCRRP